MELVVFVASLKFFFVEGGEQFIVGIQTAKKIGLKETIRVAIAGIFFATIVTGICNNWITNISAEYRISWGAT